MGGEQRGVDSFGVRTEVEHEVIQMTPRTLGFGGIETPFIDFCIGRQLVLLVIGATRTGLFFFCNVYLYHLYQKFRIRYNFGSFSLKTLVDRVKTVRVSEG